MSKTYKIMVTARGTYSKTTLYDQLDEVQAHDGIYRSLQPGNLGHDLSDTAWWVKCIDLSLLSSAVSSTQKITQEATATEQAIRINESNRQANESLRISAETTRTASEIDRAQAEDTRQNAESARVLAERGRVTAENERITNEQSRQAAFVDQYASFSAKYNTAEEARDAIFQSKEATRDAAISEILAANHGLSVVDGALCITFDK